MPDRYEPYVADPAEPPRRPALARWRGRVWALVALVLVASVTTAVLLGYGEEDPALRIPGAGAEP